MGAIVTTIKDSAEAITYLMPIVAAIKEARRQTKIIIAIIIAIIAIVLGLVYCPDTISPLNDTSFGSPSLSLSPTPLNTVIENSFESPSPSPSPQPSSTPIPPCPKIKPCKSTRMDSVHLMLIKYVGNKELRLIDILSTEWLKFWATVGFKPNELKNQIPRSELSKDEKKDKLFDVLTDWMAGKFQKKSSKPYQHTYGGLIEISRDIQLDELARDITKAIEYNHIEPDVKIELTKIMQIKYKKDDGDESEVTIFDELLEHWEDLALMVGYEVGSKDKNQKAFNHFFNKWQRQSMGSESREKYPYNFEGFRAALKDNGISEYVDQFEEAVTKACICQF